MSAPRHPVVIVGAGLSGLLAAWLLQRQGLRGVRLLEARSTPGGRILSVDAAGQQVDLQQPGADRFDLGPSWFWPDLQPQLDRLVDELGLERFAQYEQGDVAVERSPHEAARRLRGHAGSPPSMRVAGGTGALVSALVQRLEPGCLVTGHEVRRLHTASDALQLHTLTASGEARTWHAERALLALPPRLAAQRIGFDPPLPPALARRWHETATWMAPHAKYVALYERPFWRDDGLSGGARSACGPMGEIHDLSTPGGHAALFGFLGVPAHARRGVTEEVLRQHCRAQLGRLFGERAATPMADVLKDWALDPFTATDADHDTTAGHAPAPPTRAGEGPWQGRLIGIGSEWSPEFPGYLAGAVDAAFRGVRQVLADASCARQEPLR